MAQLGSAAWPPEPIQTARLTLRAAEAKDRSAMIDLFSSAEVNAHVGGPEPREYLEELMPEVPGQRAGFFAIEHNGAMIGIVTLDPRGSERPGHVDDKRDEAELGYMVLSDDWGNGYATEACTAVMAWFRTALPDEPLVVSTQLANEASLRVIQKLGFTELERFEEYGAQQWFGVLRPNHPPV